MRALASEVFQDLRGHLVASGLASSAQLDGLLRHAEGAPNTAIDGTLFLEHRISVEGGRVDYGYGFRVPAAPPVAAAWRSRERFAWERRAVAATERIAASGAPLAPHLFGAWLEYDEEADGGYGDAPALWWSLGPGYFGAELSASLASFREQIGARAHGGAELAFLARVTGLLAAGPIHLAQVGFFDAREPGQVKMLAGRANAEELLAFAGALGLEVDRALVEALDRRLAPLVPQLRSRPFLLAFDPSFGELRSLALELPIRDVQDLDARRTFVSAALEVLFERGLVTGPWRARLEEGHRRVLDGAEIDRPGAPGYLIAASHIKVACTRSAAPEAKAYFFVYHA